MSTTLAPASFGGAVPGRHGLVQSAPRSLSRIRARSAGPLDYLDPLKLHLAMGMSPDGPPTIESVACAARLHRYRPPISPHRPVVGSTNPAAGGWQTLRAHAHLPHATSNRSRIAGAMF